MALVLPVYEFIGSRDIWNTEFYSLDWQLSSFCVYFMMDMAKGEAVLLVPLISNKVDGAESNMSRSLDTHLRESDHLRTSPIKYAVTAIFTIIHPAIVNIGRRIAHIMGELIKKRLDTQNDFSFALDDTPVRPSLATSDELYRLLDDIKDDLANFGSVLSQMLAFLSAFEGNATHYGIAGPVEPMKEKLAWAIYEIAKERIIVRAFLARDR
ncbi:hypothetical protein QBC37DRAFT_435299, partial [Rhypophila decipiens]